ncbi:acyltransferase [Paraferrimonas sp. SM1919]|uniref:acyltransferase n=1 Tax=Paraferrimonas sp. SM1919 TaxID=2662263 RepID=UPI0013D350AC|nr:acyltransferase [Paraferrimonas sp. SM1919]
MKMIFLKVIENLKRKGVVNTFILVIKKVFFVFYSKKFKKSNKVFLKSGFHVSGHKNITIGDNFYAGLNLRLEAITSYGDQCFSPVLMIGDNVFLNDNVHIGCTNKVVIGDNVLMASKIFITDHNHGYYSEEMSFKHQSPDLPPSQRLITNDDSVVIGDNVWIGESVSILAGASIGNGTVIGANSVVVGRVPEFSIAVGNPAKVVKRYCVKQRAWISIE